MTRSEALACFCLSFIGGVCIASFFISSVAAAMLIFIIGLVLIGCFWERKIVVIIGFSFILFASGMFLFGFNLWKTEENYLVSFSGEEVVAKGLVSADPERGADKTQLVIDTFGKGKILVFTDKYSPCEYGDVVLIRGTVRIPEEIDGFDYRGYLAKDGISATVSYPEIEILEKGRGSPLAAWAYALKHRAGDIIRDDLSPSISPVLEAMILGSDSRMDKETKTDLSRSGLSHAIAISGSHIVIFSGMLFELLLFFGLWRKQALAGSILFTVFYIFLVGMPASGVRAGIMVGLLFLAQMLSRSSFNLRTLVFAAAAMLFFNPLLLKFDLGFQLSFLAVLGLILAGPVFNAWLDPLFWGRAKWLQEILAMTLAAEVFTLPPLISSFGYFSVVSLAANILALPMTPLLMILGILIPILGMIFPWLGWIASIPCSALLFYLMWIVRASSSLPFAVLEWRLPFAVLILIYLPFLYWIWKGRRRELDFLG